MITRHHATLDTKSTAIYSDCEAYRYQLTRVWDETGKRALFIMLNPSTATETQNDPTVERCERRARTLGYGSFRVTNIFAYRATNPKVMRAQTDPIGPANMRMTLSALGARMAITWSRAKRSKPCCVAKAFQPAIWASRKRVTQSTRSILPTHRSPKAGSDPVFCQSLILSSTHWLSDCNRSSNPLRASLLL